MQNNRCAIYSQRAKMLVISFLLFLYADTISYFHFNLLAYNQEDVVL